MGNLGFYQISVQGLVKILPGEGNYTFCCNYTRAVVSVIKRAENGPKWQKICLLHSISQEPYIIWLSFVVDKCKMIISPGTFFIFSKFWFFVLLGGWKGKKRPKMTRNSVRRTLYLRNHTSYDLHSLYTCEKG